jgi:hypothetical protein
VTNGTPVNLSTSGPGQTAAATASCAAGHTLVTGGYTLTSDTAHPQDFSNYIVVENQATTPGTAGTWTVEVLQTGSLNFIHGTPVLTVSVVCTP